MIIAEQKPLMEIKELIGDARQVLVVGCGTCVTVCFAGGARDYAYTLRSDGDAMPEDGLESGGWMHWDGDALVVVTRKDSKVKKWEDLDKKGIKAAASLGSYIEVFMKDYLKNAEVVSIAPPNTREAELVAGRVDAILTDFPTAIKVTDGGIEVISEGHWKRFEH